MHGGSLTASRAEPYDALERGSQGAAGTEGVSMTLFKRRPSAALVVACIALLVALGGTGYAAFNLPRNSVGTKQLKNNAVTTAKIKNGAVATSKIANGTITGSKLILSTIGTVPSAQNAGHASTADNASSLGGTPASSYAQFGSTLPSGTTETGVWATAAGSSTGGFEVTAIRFNPPLPLALDQSHTIFTTSTATHCAGLGQADPGYLCVYDKHDQDVAPFATGDIANGLGSAGASTTGAAIFLSPTAAPSFAEGLWSVTAP
jgi:hypothetical protein